MTENIQTTASFPEILRVAAGQDRTGEHHRLGISAVDFKLIPQDGSILVLENTFHAPGGPARHLHFDQDEWFYAEEGEFILEIGDQRFQMVPGDSILAPRQIAHVWAYTGNTRGRMLIAFLPAGKMEAFFNEVTKTNAMPAQDPALWLAHGMELLGPPLQIG